MTQGYARRSFMAHAAVAGSSAALFQPFDVMAMAHMGTAQEQEKVQQTVSEHARPTSHPADAHKLPRWMPKQTGPYNLSRPVDNHYAFAKVQANLAGGYSWLAQYGWVLLAPPGNPAFPFLGSITLVQIFATGIDAAIAPDPGPDDYVLWGTFTTIYVDPRSFEPVGKILNPYTGRMIEPPAMHYADRLAFRLDKSIIVPGVDPKFYDQPWDKAGGYSQHFINAGDEVTYTVLGSAQNPGPQQPRTDVGFWTARRDDIMDPSKTSIDCKRDISAVMKASEYSWYGIPRGDPTQIMKHYTGLKTQNLARLPDFVKTLIFDRFRDRFVI